VLFEKVSNLAKSSSQISDDPSTGKGRGGVRQSNANPVKARRARKKKSGPYGLAALLDNCMKKDKRIELLRNGFLSTESIVEDFRKMKAKVDGKRGP